MSFLQSVQPVSSLAGSTIQPEVYVSQVGGTVATSGVHTGNTQYTGTATDYNQYNPYVSSSQYQSSFMSGQGAKDLQSLMGTQSQTSAFPQGSSQSQYPNYSQPPPLLQGAPQAGSHQLGQQYGMQAQSYPPGYNPSQYPASAAIPGPPSQNPPQNFTQQNVQHQYQGGSYQQQYQQYQNYQQQGYDQQHSQSQHKYQGSGTYPGPPTGPRQRTSQNTSRHPHPRSSSALAQVRITGR